MKNSGQKIIDKAYLAGFRRGSTEVCESLRDALKTLDQKSYSEEDIIGILRGIAQCHKEVQIKSTWEK